MPIPATAANERSLFEPVEIGSLRLRNRIVRAATVETMANERGDVTPRLVGLLERLAEHQVGLILTGGMFVHPRGQSTPFQTGIHDDDQVMGLSAIPEAVHRHGGHVFAQLQHSGPQSSIVQDLLAPSDRPNLLTGRRPTRPAAHHEIRDVIRGFGQAARRAMEAGFDGVHIHAANGYLISSFSSPLANRRIDEWGGTAVNRTRFASEIVGSIRDNVPSDYPVTIKLGFADSVRDGLAVDEAVERAVTLVGAGVDAVEVSVNLMSAPEDSTRRYVAVDRRRARRDLIFNEEAYRGAEEAYFSSYSRALREKSPRTKIILVGGLRRLSTMRRVVNEELADLVALSRPFIREPDLVERLMVGGSASVQCTSCNLCLDHSKRYSLRCWRTPRYRLVQSAAIKMAQRARRSRTVDG